MRELVNQYMGQGLSRRGFLKSMTALGFSAAAAEAVLHPVEASELAGKGLDVPGAITMTGTGGELVVRQAKEAGVEYMFTNPGSFEVGLFDAFADTPGMQHIMGLHEGIVISMADGYHRVSQKPGFVNVHVIAGTAQAGGQLFNASRNGSAIVVTAGLNDNELWTDDGGLAPRPGFNQKEINRQFTKISWECRHPQTLPLMLRRAFKVAVSEPWGPTYLAMAAYALEAKGVEGHILPAERFMVRGRVRAGQDVIEEAAGMLVDARRPLIVAGDEIWKSGAQQEIVSLSEALGIGVTRYSDAFRNFPTQHPHWLGAWDVDADWASGVDLILCVGARDFGGRTIPDKPEVPLDVPVIRLGVDTSHMSRNYQTDLAVLSDVKEGLTDLLAAVESRLTKERIASLAESRSSEVKTFSSARRAKVEQEMRANLGQSPMHPDELGAVMAKTIGPDAIMVHESLTARYPNFPLGFRPGEAFWLSNASNSLGWSIGASIGAKLAAPDRQVICSVGDGALMYSSSGFWSQARYGIPVLTVVWNNHDYQTVRGAYYRYQGKMAKNGHYVGMYLGDPDIDFVSLVKSQGVPGERVERGDQLEAALKRGAEATRGGSPYLIDVEVARYGGGAESTWHQKFNLAEKMSKA